MDQNKVTPIFSVSNVSGEGMDKLKEFLARVPSRIQSSGMFQSASDPSEFFIDNVYQAIGIGTVVSGTLKSGTVKVG